MFRKGKFTGAQRTQGGFTLIEVMIVVVIVGILVAVALPAYQGSMQKGRRSDAKSVLLDAINRQESYLLDRNTYTTDMTDLGYGNSPMVSEEGYYSISASDCDGGTDTDKLRTCVKLTATPVAGKAQDDDTRCTFFTLDSRGDRGAGGSTPTECW